MTQQNFRASAMGANSGRLDTRGRGRRASRLGALWWFGAVLGLVPGCGGCDSGGNPNNPNADGGSETPSIPAFAFQLLRPPAIPSAECQGVGSTTAVIERVQFAQTILFETSDPLFHLAANRNTAMRVVVTGSGSAPDVRVTAEANGTTLGSVCLVGPASLAPAEPSDPGASGAFVGSLPAEWVVAGLELTVTAGDATHTVASAELNIGPAPVFTFVTMDWLLWGFSTPTPLPARFGEEFGARLPVSAVQFAAFPVSPALDVLPIEPRDDGISPSGSRASMPAQLATELPHCSPADVEAEQCAGWGGYGVLSAVYLLTSKVQAANGLARAAHWYGALAQGAAVGGGIGGGVTGSGDDYGGTFNHELGHAFDMPHWGDVLYTRTNGDARHPYTGQYTYDVDTLYGGGVGDSWAFDPAAPTFFINPVCPSTGKERQDPMQRWGDMCIAAGGTYDYFSDYSAHYAFRYFTGAATTYAGTVASPRDATGNTTPPFSLPPAGGRPNMVIDPAGGAPRFERWDAASGEYVTLGPVAGSELDFEMNYPLEWDVPVYTLWGSFSTTTPEATVILPPMLYRGGLPRTIDPTDPEDFTRLKASVGDFVFWYGADLVVEAVFDDGTVRRALVREAPRGEGELNGQSFAHWAVNIAAVPGARLERVVLYHRPMEVRSTDSGDTSSPDYNARNINSTMNTDLTADTYLRTATRVATLDLDTPL